MPSALGSGEEMEGGERGSHLSLEHQIWLASMRMKMMNRNPTTEARRTSHGFS